MNLIKQFFANRNKKKIYDWINSIIYQSCYHRQNKKYVTSVNIYRECSRDDMYMFRRFCAEVAKDESITEIKIEAMVDGYLYPVIKITALKQSNNEQSI